MWPRALSPRPDGFPAVVGHRGARALCPENTLRCLLHAVSLGVDSAEFDVRTTRDGIPILHHDPDFQRLSELGARVALVTLRWVRENVRILGEPVPTLAEAVETLRGAPVILLVELKTTGWREAGGILEGLEGRAVVSSFKHRLLEDVSGFPRVLVSGRRPRRIPDVEGVLIHHSRLDPEYVSELKASGLAVGTWTVDDPGLALSLGPIDFVVSDDPRRHLATRGVKPRY